MTTTFSAVAALMLLVALAFLLWPMLRRRGGSALHAKRVALEKARRAGVLSDKEVRRKLAELGDDGSHGEPASRLLPAVLALLVPLAAILMYRQLGEPRALDPVWRDAVAATATSADGTPATSAPDMEQAVAGLAERMRQEPDDIEGWMLLGRAYKTMERFEPAREALANAHRLAPDDPDVMIEYAEAQVLASQSRRFIGEPLELLTRAVELQPDSQRGLWLLGIAGYQAENFTQAVQVWERLLASLPPDAEPRQQLIERIADARERGGLAPMIEDASATAAPGTAPMSATPAPAAMAAPTPASAEGPRLTVTVDITPELKSQLGASDVLFVFARAAEGPRMPLAIQRLPAAALPVTVTLDDSTSMMPALKLSTMPRIVVGARVSKSGQATPQPGDFETMSDPIANTHSAPLALLIDRVVP